MQEEPLRYKPLADSTPAVEIFPGQVSCRGQRWLLRQSSERTSLTMSQRFGLDPCLADILSARGFALEDLSHYMDPTLQATLPDPSHLLDMDKAVARLLTAVEKKQDIYLFGDYDVDGATSTTLLHRFLRTIGATVRFYIPDRMREGYGPNPTNLKLLRDRGAEVVVTLDCGSTAFEALEAGTASGLDIIVLDHHIGEAQLPKAVAVVNPNRADESSPHKQIAAVGVTFLFVMAMARALKTASWFKGRLPDIREYLDLVALGTVADVMPLTGLNRAFVRQGLKIWAMQHNLGLKVLGEVAGLDKAVDAYALGYVFGPRINAGGRVGQADLGTRLLTTTDIAEARTLAQELHHLNRERQDIEKQVLQQAMEAVEHGGHKDLPFLCVAGDNWHPGVIGIVAGRLKELYAKPTFVVSFDEDIGKGSGRSVAGVDLGHLVHAARDKGLVINGGGHAMAAGITVSKATFNDFQAHLNEAIKDQDLTPTLMVDTSLSATGASFAMAESLKALEPMGMGNPSPKFLLKNLMVTYAEVVGEQHVRCTLKGEEGSVIQAIAFRAVSNQLGEVLLAKSFRPCHVVGTLKVDEWQGRKKVQLQIEDVLV
jgi:single-stranded-DNA-specific exonuclease